MEFRPRNYTAEEATYSLPRSHADTHPLSTPSPSHHQVDVVDHKKDDFYDPLRGSDANGKVSIDNLQDEENSSAVSKADVGLPEKEWTSFKKLLMQRFSGPKMVSISKMSDVIVKSGKVHEKTSTTMPLEELDDPQKFAEDGIKVISQQEYVSRLHELKDEVARAWRADDRVTSLKVSIKVARLLTDTSVLQFYPTLFVLATDVMDMLGNMVWQRIKQKAEFAEDGNVICSLPENFDEKYICLDAKETCSNWFFKIGSIRELLPRIYLELAILPCWRFLLNRPMDVLERLVMMTRGIADPLASAYCRLYLAHCAQKLPQHNTRYLIICINDMEILLTRFLSEKEATHEKFSENCGSFVSLTEPAIEYIIKCIIKESYQTRAGEVLMDLGLGRKQPCVSIILHHLLKELSSELVGSNALEILQLIECSKDYSFDQCLNYRLLGFRLSERSQLDIINAVVDKIIQVVSAYNNLDEYLKVIDAYVDIILQNQMDNHLHVILDGIAKRACNEGIAEIELTSLQSIFLKLLAHFNNLEDIFSLTHFIEILDMMHGSSRSMVNMHILNIATRNRCIGDPTIIQFIFEVSQSLHDGIDYSNMRDDDNQQRARLISRFVNMVDYGTEVERQLAFLVECRGAFRSINELKETLVRSSNCLAVKAMKDGKKHLSFVKSCIAYSEVTIPSVPSRVRQFILYLETAEIALLGGLVSHSDGLLDSAIICLQTLDLMDGNAERGVTYIPRCMLTLINSQSWMTSRMRTMVLCAIVSLAATLSQFKLPYHANHEEMLGNDHLFFGDPTYLQELLSLSALILQNLVDFIMQEPSRVARGSMALEACNCIASSFNPSHEVLPFFSKLMETAKSCLSSNDKYLHSTIKCTAKFLQTNT
ncbi:VPS35 endosomal protein sorting factor-like [Camellia lanceoleosa]|uniref:VPS35 endosomal protein sorting factor-like n=1 Tax=Camellia lanceoleosa TaxID=1840588 RepID=A0ACC0HEU9_9ERIC|nr:VPS35 endosomal protein sorting factor-like [Camellia lanceoleosa]